MLERAHFEQTGLYIMRTLFNNCEELEIVKILKTIVKLSHDGGMKVGQILAFFGGEKAESIARLLDEGVPVMAESPRTIDAAGPAAVGRANQKMLELNEKPIIADWHDAFVAIADFAAARPDQFGSIEVSFNGGGSEKKFMIQIPRVAPPEIIRIVSRYLAAVINNYAVCFGAAGIKIESDFRDLPPMVAARFDEEYNEYGGNSLGRYSIKEMMGLFDVSSFIETHPAGSIVTDREKSVIRMPGTVLGINIGQTKTRISIMKIGSTGEIEPVGKFFEMRTWGKSGERSDADGLIARILENARRVVGLSQVSIEAIGVSVASSVKDGRPLKIPLGVIRDFTPNSMNTWSRLPELISSEFNGIPCLVDNDGNLLALHLHKKLRKNNLLALRFGTTLCAGYVDQAGAVPSGFNGYNKVRVNMTDEAQADPYYRGRMGNYLSFRGIVHLAGKHGLLQKYQLDENSAPVKIKEMLAGASSEGREDARKIYQEIGGYAAASIVELLNYYDIENAALMGSIIEGEAAEMIIRTAEAELKKRGISVNLLYIAESAEEAGHIGAAHFLPQIF
ncbi:MAG: ROK family protein [Candidatus Margulisiibacteriota bacterium]